MAAKTYATQLTDLKAALKAGEITQATFDDLAKALAEGEYAPQADLTQFDSLLGKLEDSKMRQQRQKSVEGRRDVFSQGMASMMNNF